MTWYFQVSTTPALRTTSDASIAMAASRPGSSTTIRGSNTPGQLQKSHRINDRIHCHTTSVHEVALCSGHHRIQSEECDVVDGIAFIYSLTHYILTWQQTTRQQTTGLQTTGQHTAGLQTNGLQTTGLQTTGLQTTGLQTIGQQNTYSRLIFLLMFLILPLQPSFWAI